MKTPILLGIVTGLTAFTAIAQEDNSQGGNQNNPCGERKGPPPSRLVLVLDADHDKVISADEIAASPVALAKLDRNSDGELTKEEFARPKPRKGARAREDGGKPSGQRPPPPDRVAGALDSDHDRVITAGEIAAAPESLATLDKNEDGRLTPNEFAPKPRRKPHGSDENSDSQANQQGGGEDEEGPGGDSQPPRSGPGGQQQQGSRDPR